MKRTTIVLTSILATAAMATEKNAIDELKPGHWFEVPDSHLNQVAFKWPKGVFYTQNGLGLKAIISTWSGGAFDTKRERLLIWGGGHFAYGGNEIYGFDVNKLKWERLCDPSLKVSKDYPNGNDKYSDGTPRAAHTYGYIQYVPTIDRFCSFGTCANFPASKGGKTTWAFDFEKKKWETRAPVPSVGFGTSSVWDPVEEKIWCRINGMKAILASWEPIKDKWSVHIGRLSHRTYYNHSGALDPLGRRYVIIGGSKGAAGYTYDLDGPKFSQKKLVTTGPQDAQGARNPGFQYDPVLDKFVAWKGGAELYVLDPLTWKWEKRAPATDNKVTPTRPCKTGTYGRFRYIPSRNAYIVVNSVSESVYIGRLSSRAQSPIPKRFLAALKDKNVKLVKYVAGQVALWPVEKSEPELKKAVDAQKSAKNAEAVEAIKKALNALKSPAKAE